MKKNLRWYDKDKYLSAFMTLLQQLPEFTQVDCEMSFVEKEDVINMFEGLVKHIFKYVKNIDFTEPFPRMTWHDAMRLYGSDKPDIRFGMPFVELTDLVKGSGFAVMDDAELTVGICVPGCAGYTRKQTDELTEFVKRPQIGAKGLANSLQTSRSVSGLNAWGQVMETCYLS